MCGAEYLEGLATAVDAEELYRINGNTHGNPQPDADCKPNAFTHAVAGFGRYSGSRRTNRHCGASDINYGSSDRHSRRNFSSDASSHASGHAHGYVLGYVLGYAHAKGHAP